MKLVFQHSLLTIMTTESVDHSPHAHPASPTHSLPESFASYRSKAQQHGPLGGGGNNGGGPAAGGSSQASSSPPHISAPTTSSVTYGAIGGTPGRSLGSVKPKDGEFFDRDELPKRFQRKVWSDEEIEAVDSAGASIFS
jgi:small subunit ribosomal protein YMR-31